jgi:magnesium and cobalt transporter
MPELGEEADTIGGHVVALLGRLPRQGDELELGDYHVTVAEVTRRRIIKLRFERRASAEPSTEAEVARG